MHRWRGLKQLVHDGVDATVELVREGHASTARTLDRLTPPVDAVRAPVQAVEGVRRLGTSAVLSTIRRTNRAVEWLTDAGLDRAGAGVDAPLAPPVPMSSDAAGSVSWLGDAAVGALNAAVGSHLARTRNRLDLEMALRVGDTYVPLEAQAIAAAFPDASPRLAVFVHGLGVTEWSWCMSSAAHHGDPRVCFGTRLQQDLGFTPVYIRYNTGRTVADNGRQLAALLELLVTHYPGPLDDLTLIGHSMGGLVARSACVHAEQRGHRWGATTRRVVYLGSPHRGAPLAAMGQVLAHTLSAIDLPATRILSRIADGRSDGVKDLRDGGLSTDATGDPDAPLPLPHARHVFVAATVTRDPQHPVGRVIGDLLVRESSAAGPPTHSALHIERHHHGGVLHHQLQNHPAVYAQLRACCAGA